MKRLFLMLTALIFSMNINASDKMGFETTDEVIQMQLIHFDTDSSRLDSIARKTLRELDLSNDADVVIIGKTDSRGSDDYNVALGMRRAHSVAEFLEVQDASISSVGKSEAVETVRNEMRSDRVVLVKIINLTINVHPVFGDANLRIQGPTSHLQYNTVPLGQGTNRQAPRM